MGRIETLRPDGPPIRQAQGRQDSHLLGCSIVNGRSPSRSLRGKRDGPAGAKTENSVRRGGSVVKNILSIYSSIRMSCGNLFERKRKKTSGLSPSAPSAVVPRVPSPFVPSV